MIYSSPSEISRASNPPYTLEILFPVSFLNEVKAHTSLGSLLVNGAVPRVGIDLVHDINTFQSTSSEILCVNAKWEAVVPQRLVSKIPYITACESCVILEQSSFKGHLSSTN